MATFRLDGEDMHVMTRDGLGNPSTGEVSVARIMQYINLGALELVKAKPGKFSVLFDAEEISTVATQREYPLTETKLVGIRFVSSSWQPRLKRKDEDYSYRIGTGTSPSPWAWYPAGGSNDGDWVIGLIGTPSVTGKTLTAHMTLIPPEIIYDAATASTTNTSVLPQHYDLPIVAKAIEIGLMLSGRRKDATAAMKLAIPTEARARRADPGAIEHLWDVGGSLSDVKVP